MNFSYVNTIEDYVEAVKITRSINPLYKFFLGFLPWFMSSIVLVVGFFDIKSDGGNFVQLSIIVLTLMIITFYCVFRLPKRMDKGLVKKIHSNKKLNENISVERKVVLTEEKILISINDEKVELKLEDIGSVM